MNHEHPDSEPDLRSNQGLKLTFHKSSSKNYKIGSKTLLR